MNPSPELGREELAEGEPPSLEQDLLAASESLYHREVGQFQALQTKRMIATEVATQDWSREEKEKGGSPVYIDWLCAEHVRKVKGTLHAESEEMIREQAWKKATRDSAILLFCSKQPQ